jgi:type IV pilus assembly protein PilO
MNISLSKLPWHAQMGVFFALALAAVGVFYYFYASAAQVELDARLQKLQGLQAEIASGTAVGRRLPQFKKDVATLEARLEALKAVLPEQKDIGALILNMQTLAMQSNLRITTFKPVATVTKPMHVEVPHAVELDGTYHNFGVFLDRLGKLPRIIQVSDIGIKAKDRPELTGTVSARCVATTFVLIDPVKAKPAPAAKPAPR